MPACYDLSLIFSLILKVLSSEIKTQDMNFKWFYLSSSGLYFIPSSNFKKRNFSFCYHQSTANTPQAQSNRPSPVYMKGGFALYGETHPERNPQFSFHRSASYSCFVTDLENTVKTKLLTVAFNTGSPSSKQEHRRASVLLRNIQNIRIFMGKNLSFL